MLEQIGSGEEGYPVQPPHKDSGRDSTPFPSRLATEVLTHTPEGASVGGPVEDKGTRGVFR